MQSFGNRMRLEVLVVVRAQEIFPVLEQRNREERIHSEHNFHKGNSKALLQRNFFPKNQIQRREPFLTSSDPVSDGLAFFGAMTGESDPSKSSCNK